MEVTNPQPQQQPQDPYYSPMRPSGSVTVGDWLLTMLIMIIPLVNLIMLFVWAFGSGTNESKANWAKASLLWMLIGIVIAFIFGGAILGLIARMGYY